MGVADLSIAEIAAEHNLLLAKVCHLCEELGIGEELGIAYKTQETRLALEDAMTVLLKFCPKDTIQSHLLVRKIS
jgi:hypothetical protein